MTLDPWMVSFKVVTLKEAKLLLKEDDDLIIAVYDYWLNKRLKSMTVSTQVLDTHVCSF